MKHLAIIAALGVGVIGSTFAQCPIGGYPPPTAGVATVTIPSAQPQPTPQSTPTLTPRTTPTPGQGGGTTPGFGGGGSTPAQPKKASGGAGRVTTRWGRSNRTPNVADLLDFGWINVEWPRGKGSDGYDTRIMPLSALIHERCFDPRCTDHACGHKKCPDPSCLHDKKPAMVYIFDPMVKRADKHDREKDMFGGTDDIAALSNFVHCFQMAADDVEAREFHAGFGKKLPAIIFIAPNGKTLDVLEGNIRQGQLRKAFKKTLEYTYSLKSGKALIKLEAIHARMEKIEDELAVIVPRLAALEAKQRVQHSSRSSAQMEKARKKYRAAASRLQALGLERSALLNRRVTCGAAPTTAQ